MRLQLKSIFPSRDLGWNRVRALCAQPDCHNKLLTRFVPGSPAGITVRADWYCSADCFAQGIRGILHSLSGEEVVEVPRTPRLSLGLALLTKGYLTTEQFRYATARNSADGVDVEATVVEQGWVTEKHLAAARAAQWGYPVLGQDLSGHSVVADLPPTLFHACKATPLYYSSDYKRLVLGFVQRVDHSMLQAIEQISGCRAEPCFITPTELTRQLYRLTAPRGYKEAVVERPGAAREMAMSLGGYALQIAAREAFFTRCHSFLWTRLTGNKGTMDVLFDLNVAAAEVPSASTQDVVQIHRGMFERVFVARAGWRH
jgi:hypothetical protein